VFTLTWPIALALLGDTAMGLTDTKLVSGLGKNAIGGVGVAVMLMYLAYSIVSGTLRGVKVNTAFAVGEGHPERAAPYAWAGVLGAVLAGSLICALGRDITWILHLLRVREELLPVTRDFFAAITWGAPGACVQQALVQYRQGLGDARTPTAVQVTGNVLNAFLAYGLVYGHFGFRPHGVAGAGYATAAVVSFNAVVLSALFLRRRPTPALLLRALRAVVSVGLPTGLQFSVELLAMVTFTVILGGIAPEEIAGHQVALMILRTSFLPGVAISEACSVLVGQSLGAGDTNRARLATRASLRIAIAFMACCGVVFALFGGTLAGAFTREEEVRRVIVHLLLLAALFQVPDAVNVVLRGALRGAKDARVPARISVLCIWLFVPSSAFVLGKVLGFGALGGWVGFVLETFVAATLLSRRWREGAWRLSASPVTKDETRSVPVPPSSAHAA
jgi:MATE family multidrug resistance protein